MTLVNLIASLYCNSKIGKMMAFSEFRHLFFGHIFLSLNLITLQIRRLRTILKIWAGETTAA